MQRDDATMAVPLSGVDVGVSERTYVNAALDGGWLSGTGPHVRQFEQRLAERLHRGHVVAVANGTLAIELVLRAMGIGPGDEVIVPALTFAAPASSILAVGATPVLADVSPVSWTLCPDGAAATVTARTKAILAVDVLGHPADYDRLAALGLPIIEDAAEAHGASYKGKPVGSMGVASILSFHANKAITTGEGGCVATDSADLAGLMRVIANHGMRPDQPYVHEVIGRNHRMTNLAAAVGLGQLDRWDELIENRNHVSAEYAKLLDGTGCEARPVADWAGYSCWLHTITVPRRAEVLAFVRQRGVDARAIWPALSTQPLFGAGERTFPIAEAIASSAIWLPTHSAMTSDAVVFVARTLKQALARAAGGVE
jgi:perosamine synthetase